MVHKKVSKNNISILMLSSLLFLPSCGLIDWIKEKFGGGTPAAPSTQPMGGPARADGSPILATIDGKPLITKNMLESEKARLIESNPQLQAMIALMDERQLDRNLMDGLTSREAIRKYVKENKIEESDKYKKDFEMVLNQVRDALNTRYFMEAFTEQVNDAEVQAYYDANKDAVPNLLLSRGGIAAKGVSFKDRQEAKDFATKVKAVKNDIEKAAKEAGENCVKDFKLVNEDSFGIDETLKTRITTMKTFPRVEVVKAGDEYWTVVATSKEAPKYRPLEQVRAELKQAIEKEKTMKRFEQEVARLKDEYSIEIDESFFAEKPEDNAVALTAENEAAVTEGAKVAENAPASDESTRKPTQAVAQTEKPSTPATTQVA